MKESGETIPKMIERGNQRPAGERSIAQKGRNRKCSESLSLSLLDDRGRTDGAKGVRDEFSVGVLVHRQLLRSPGRLKDIRSTPCGQIQILPERFCVYLYDKSTRFHITVTDSIFYQGRPEIVWALAKIDKWLFD
jgi:hypothetical protein